MVLSNKWYSTAHEQRRVRVYSPRSQLACHMHAIHTQAPVQVICGVALGLQKYSSISRVFESSS